jgi:hypothetical protein
MSFYFRKEEPYGPYRFDGVPDVFGPYPGGVVHEEEYSKKPVTSDKRAGDSHHPECEYDDIHLDTCMCFELYNKDYDTKLEKEETERWQYYNGTLDA